MATIVGEPANTWQHFMPGTDADDDIFPLGGWDIVNGYDGVDTVYVEGRSNRFNLVAEDGVVYIDSLSAASAYAERVQLINIEKVHFWDELVDLRMNRVFRDQEVNTLISGGVGNDTMIYSGSRDNYSIETAGLYTFVSTKEATTAGLGYRFDRLESIEVIQFADQVVSFSLDAASVPGQAARFVSVVLGPGFLNNTGVSGLVVNALNQGVSLEDLASAGAETDLFFSLAGSESNMDFVRHLYQNLLDVSPSTTDLQVLTELIDSGVYSKGSFAVAAIALADSLGHVDFAGLASQGWAYNLVG